MTAEIQFTVILDDPLANSYIQNPYAPDEDPKMTIELYERSFLQNEELGLNDIQVRVAFYWTLLQCSFVMDRLKRMKEKRKLKLLLMLLMLLMRRMRRRG